MKEIREERKGIRKGKKGTRKERVDGIENDTLHNNSVKQIKQLIGMCISNEITA